MSRNLNKVMLIGHLGGDPQVKDLGTGSKVCNFSLATTESWKDKGTQERKERTEWHRVAVFGRLAEIAGEHLHKGSLVYIEGNLRTRKWQDKDGVDRYSTEIVASELVFLSSSKGGVAADEAETDEVTDDETQSA